MQHYKNECDMFIQWSASVLSFILALVLGLADLHFLATCYITYRLYSVQSIQYALLFTYADLLCCCCLKDFFFFKKKAPSPSIRSIFEHKNVGKFLGWEFSCCSYHQKKQNNCITKHFWKLETQYFIQLFFGYQGTYIGCILVYFVPGDIVLTAW